MKMVVAIIQPQQLPAVKRALFEAQVRPVTCTNILGTAPEGAETRSFRGVPQKVSLFQKVRVELALRDELVNRAIDAISLGANESGGFGIVFVTDLLEVVSLRTGERGERALQ
jgi:nitrogen regulatory protein PII